MAAIFLLAIAFLVWMINSTLKGAHEKRNVTSIFQKIILNHLQLILLTAAFNFNWPEVVMAFFNASQPLGNPSSQVFSVDCFLNGDSGIIENSSATNSTISDSKFPIRIFYFKILLFSILPFMIFIISYGVWAVILIKEKDKHVLWNKSISTVIILLFFVHPSIVNYVFNAFK